MGVGLGDDAHAGPTGVAENGRLGRVRGDREVQQLVAGDSGSERARVVAQLSDLRGRLVHEAQAVVGRPHRSAAEQRIAGALEQQCPHPGRVEVAAVAADEHVQPRGVAPPHFEAVERAQRRLDRREGLD